MTSGPLEELIIFTGKNLKLFIVGSDQKLGGKGPLPLAPDIPGEAAPGYPGK